MKIRIALFIELRNELDQESRAMGTSSGFRLPFGLRAAENIESARERSHPAWMSRLACPVRKIAAGGPERAMKLKSMFAEPEVTWTQVCRDSSTAPHEAQRAKPAPPAKS
jgi:hypothetical protein